MTNAERFQTSDERYVEFRNFCRKYACGDCPLGEDGILESKCCFKWLDLEYKEELKDCPFCGGKAGVVSGIHEGCEYHWVECSECYGRSIGTSFADRTIAAWNRRV